MTWALFLFFACSPLARADAYAPWLDCEGLEEGDECGSPDGSYDGRCVLNPDCTPDSASETGDANTCLLCESIGDVRKDDEFACFGCSALGREDAGVFGIQGLVGLIGLGLLARRRRP